ncbi:MAG: hypothetical protein ACLR4Z_09645 [Butyricicoccaceae bacterium]
MAKLIRFMQQAAAAAFFDEFCPFLQCVPDVPILCDVIAIPPETVLDRFGSFRNFPILLLSHVAGGAGGFDGYDRICTSAGKSGMLVSEHRKILR